MTARTRTFALWLAMATLWFLTSPTGMAISKILDL